MNRMNSILLSVFITLSIMACRAQSQPSIMFSDECITAPLVACNQEFTVITRGATSNPTDPPFGCDVPAQRRGGGTVWFRFIAPAATVTITTANSPTPVEFTALAVYRAAGAPPCGALVQMGCSIGLEDGGPFLAALTLNGLSSGHEYVVEVASLVKQHEGYVRVGLYSPALPPPTGGCLFSNGTCEVLTLDQCMVSDGWYLGNGTTCADSPCQTRPANDACDGAQAITQLGVPIQTTNLCATDDIPVARLCPQAIPGNRTLWYSIVGDGSMMEATTCHFETGAETVIAVLCGPCNDLHCVEMENRPGPGCINENMSTVRWCSEVGRTYMLAVASFGSCSPGSITLTVRSVGSCGTPRLCCRADHNRDDAVTSTDFFDFLVDFFNAAADFNRDGVTNTQDYFDYLNHYQVGC